MKKTLLSTAAALFILSLAGCAGTAEPVQTEDRPQITAEVSAKPTAPVESAPVLFSAGDEQPIEDGTQNSTASEEPTASPEPDAPALVAAPAPKVGTPAPQEIPASVSVAPAPQETQAPAKAVIKFEVTTQKGTEESPSPAPSATPEPTPEPALTPTPTPTPPAESVPPVESTAPAFNINYWISYAQSYARGVGLTLDPTATACWDNPIAAGAHCAYLERDIQSRLNRYARDESITDVWIWAEQRTDGSYDFYIGYA